MVIGKRKEITSDSDADDNLDIQSQNMKSRQIRDDDSVSKRSNNQSELGLVRHYGPRADGKQSVNSTGRSKKRNLD